jgi:hypothetical protein
MTTPQQKTMKKEKKTPEYIMFNVLQTKNTSFELTYRAFQENYIQEYPEHIETTEEFEERCKTIWKKVSEETDKHDEIELDEADCDDDVDEEYVCDASHDFIQPIVDKYDETCPKFKAFLEYEQKRQIEEDRKRAEAKAKAEHEAKEKVKQQKIAELTAQLEKLRSS